MSIAGANSRCLILVPRGHDAPIDLVEGLARRRVLMQEVADAPAVMVALAAATREQPIVALVIVEPAMFVDAEALVAAVKRHHRAAVWRYRYGSDPRLSRLGTDAATEQPAMSEPGPAPAAEPELLPLKFPHEYEPLPTVLTDDELAMLMGHDHPTPREGAGP